MSWLTWLVVGAALLFAALFAVGAPLLSLLVLVAATGYLAVVAVQARRAIRDPSWRLPRCRECGTAVPAAAAVCPVCGSVAIDRPGRAAPPRAGAAERATAQRAADAAPTPPLRPDGPPDMGPAGGSFE